MILVTTTTEAATVRFHYDPKAVEIIKTVPGRRWDPEAKTWTIGVDWVQLLARRFHDAGYPVQIDRKLWTPPAVSTTGPALPAFYQQLPDRLKEPVYKALIKVLHPDAGGDTALAQQLNTARDKHRCG